MAPAIPEIIWYALLFFVLAFAFTSRKLTKALFGPLITILQAIPAIGSKLAAPFVAIEKAITSACGSIEAGCDKLMGTSFHATARLMDWVWKQIKKHAMTLAVAAPIIGNLANLYEGLRALVHRSSHIAQGITRAVKTLEREYHGIEHRVKVLERKIAKGIGHDLRVRIAGLEDEVTTLENKVIPSIRAAANEAEADVTALGKYVEDHFVRNTTAEIEAAVAVGLAALGLSGLRCNSNPFKNNKNACGLFGDLSSLLGVPAIVLSVSSFEELVKEMQALEQGIIAGLEELLDIAA